MKMLSNLYRRSFVKRSKFNGISLVKYGFSTTTPAEVVDKCHKIMASIQPINDKYKGPLDKTAQTNTVLPFVFLLGNHSSGKSSFINYVLQRKIQVTGVAPTDDAFTILAPGPADVDRDGPAVIGDPDMGFSGLTPFGPQLIHHTQLKVRCNTGIKDFMIVDTPGMIDSPTVKNSYGVSQMAAMGRGYDFERVCRWYAERADVILLFFDPDKPGTTGETLSILTNSLVGLDHKLHIILNKADQFRKIHDFARAYGSLCWNLSKVIQRKDLPRIYTMCLPPTFHAVASGDQSTEGQTLGQGVIDLEATREEVVAEVFNAPKRRVDNEISRLSDAVAMLRMHCNLVDDMKNQYRGTMWRYKALQLAASLLTVGIPVAVVTTGMPLEVAGAIGGTGAISVGLMQWWQSRALDSLAHYLVSNESLEKSFKRLYAKKIAEKDETTASLWARVGELMKLSLTYKDLQNLGKVKEADLNELTRIADVEIPTLRRFAGPAINKRQ